MLMIGKTTKQGKRGILECLDVEEIVVGDGGFVFALEKRGYVKSGPEATVEHPKAGQQQVFINNGRGIFNVSGSTVKCGMINSIKT